MLSVILFALFNLIAVQVHAAEVAAEEQQYTFFYAVMDVKGCTASVGKHEGFWVSTTAKAKTHIFDEEAYTKHSKTAFGKREFLKECKNWELYLFKNFTNRSKARKHKREQKNALKKLADVHNWTLSID